MLVSPMSLLLIMPILAWCHPAIVTEDSTRLLPRVPTHSQERSIHNNRNPCHNLTQLVPPQAPTTLPPPSGILSSILIARGTQNYSCPIASTYTNMSAPTPLGAVAILYNATCISASLHEKLSTAVLQIPFSASNFSDPCASHLRVPNVARHGDLALPFVGRHYFVNATTPRWQFKGKKGWMEGRKVANSSVPAVEVAGVAVPSVPWLALEAIAEEGGWREVYRVRTAGGVAPASCKGIEGVVQVEYAAEYWSYK